MAKFWIVFKQVYKKNLMSGTFLVMMLTPVLMLAFVFIIGYFVGAQHQTPTIAIVGADPQRAVLLSAKTKDYGVKASIATVRSARQALAASKIDGYLQLEGRGTHVSAVYTDRDNGNDLDVDNLQKELGRIQIGLSAARLHLSDADLQTLLSGVQVSKKTVAVENGKLINKSNAQKAINSVIALVITLIMYIFIVNYSSMIAQEIASEKGTRIMEIVLSSVSATTHFFGKLIGSLALVITQAAVYAVSVLVAWQFVKAWPQVRAFTTHIHLDILWSPVILYTLIYFVIGILLFTALSAMLGSLVSSVEQVAQAISPLIVLGLAAYLGGFYAMNAGSTLVVKIASYVPFFSEIIMPVRYAVGRATDSEAWASLGLSAIAVVFVTWLALAFYRRNVLVYSNAGMWESLRRSTSSLMKRRV
ncbi:MAG: ABC transporter permease [Sporolactobacillus sp.]